MKNIDSNGMHDIGEDTVIKWLSIASRAIDNRLNKALAQYGINQSQHFYILKIHDNPNITEDQLIESNFLNQSNVTRAITQLEKLGLVTKTRCEHDKRKFSLALTAAGNQLYPAIANLIATEEQKISQIAAKDNPNFNESSFLTGLHNISRM